MASSSSREVVLIIGAGLGGLALAQLLRQSSSSIEVMIFERDQNEYSRDQGYCIGIDSMGLKVLNKIHALNDLLDDQSDGHYNLNYFRLVNRSLGNLVDFNAKGSKLIYREDLRRALLTNLDIQWNKKFLYYKIHDGSVEAHFSDGTSVHGTILIGCDGAKSLVREQLIPNFERNNLGLVNIGGTIEQDDRLTRIQQLTENSLVRIFGREGHSLLLLPFRQSLIWALSWPEPTERLEYSSSLLIEKATQHFDHEEVIRLIERTSSTHFIGPFRLFSSAILTKNPFPNNLRVILLGDAAHPMTTHAGKGANTAFADADDLAQILIEPTKINLAKYEETMFQRGFAAVKVSLASTKMIHSTGLKGQVRDTIFVIMHYIFLVVGWIQRPFNLLFNKHD